jgi:hemoglobin
MERRERITAEIVKRTGIDEHMIERLVRRFYEKVRGDALLGPVFAARIRDWEPHLQRMCAFWSSVALMSGRYHGNPMTKHLPLPVDAAHFVERAWRIAESLELGIAGGRGILLRRGERLRHGSRLDGTAKHDEAPPRLVGN